MSSNEKIEFTNICLDILDNPKFKSLDNELHHGITRYAHSLRVAKSTYYLCKHLHLAHLEEITRAALLHDFYNDNDFPQSTSYARLSLHPSLALANALHDYSLTPLQQDIIVKHMFPMTKSLPKYPASYLVSLTDKAVATYEMCNFKLSLKLSLLLIFIYNCLTIQK